MENEQNTQFAQPEQAPQPAAQPAPQPQQPAYQAPPQPAYQQQPVIAPLKANYGLLKTILLSIITLGIYGLVVMSRVSTDINTIASRYDGKRTMHYCLLFFLVGPITLGIADIVWSHKISARIGNELIRRGLNYKFNAASYWLWNVLGACIIVGPFVYCFKLFKAMNLLCADYNAKG